MLNEVMVREQLKKLGIAQEWIDGLDLSAVKFELPEGVLHKLLEMRATLGPWDLVEGETYDITFTHYEPTHDYVSLEGVATDKDGNQFQIAQMFWHYSKKNKKFFNNAKFIRPMLAQVKDLPAPLVQAGFTGIVAAFAAFGCIECQAKIMVNPEMVSKDRNGHEFVFDLTRQPAKKAKKLR